MVHYTCTGDMYNVGDIGDIGDGMSIVSCDLSKCLLCTVVSFHTHTHLYCVVMIL